MSAWRGAIGVVLLLAGCPSLGVAPRPLRPVLGEEVRIAGFIRAAQERGLARRGLRAYGRIRVESPEGKGRWREVVLVERPDRLRLETLNFLGQTQTLLVSDGDEYSFYDGRALESGAADDEILRDRLGFDISARDAIAVLLAAPPLAGESPQQIFADGGERVVEFEMQRVRFAPDGRLLGVERLDPRGETIWSAEFADFRDDASAFPMELALAFPRTGFRVALELEDVELNPDLDRALFDVTP